MAAEGGQLADAEEPPKVMPLPAAQLRGALAQHLLGRAGVARAPLGVSWPNAPGDRRPRPRVWGFPGMPPLPNPPREPRQEDDHEQGHHRRQDRLPPRPLEGALAAADRPRLDRFASQPALQ